MLTATSPPARVAVARAAILVFVLGALIGGCATITRGVTQDIQIATDPTGAVCELRRGEDIVDSVASTPGYVRVRKGVGRYALACRRDGHLEAGATLEAGVDGGQIGGIAWGALSGLQGTAGATVTSTALSTVMPAAAATTGAAALGIAGALSFAVDLASGAMFEYPPSIALTLVPSSFATEEARDAFFARQEARLRSQYGARRNDVADDCRRIKCPGTLAALDAALERELAELASLKPNVRIGD